MKGKTDLVTLTNLKQKVYNKSSFILQQLLFNKKQATQLQLPQKVVQTVNLQNST
jgi:hypothetical protein